MILDHMLRLLGYAYILSSCDAYTAQDISEYCEPCINNGRLAHPGDCHKYFICEVQEWVEKSCGQGVFKLDTGRCASRQHNGCPSNFQYQFLTDISLEPACDHITSRRTPTTPRLPQSPSTTAKVTQSPVAGSSQGSVYTTLSGTADSEHRTTILLASLLGVTFLVLLFVIVGIIVWRRKHRSQQSRKTDMRNRRLPLTKDMAAENVTYSQGLLTSNEDTVYSEIKESPYESPEGYTQISDLDRQGAAVVDPVAASAHYTSTAIVTRDTHPYDKPSQVKYNYHHSKVAVPHTYDRPNVGSPNSPGQRDDSFDYSYAQDAVPTLNIREQLPPPPPTPPYYVDAIPDSPPDSPPYYIDPIADSPGLPSPPPSPPAESGSLPVRRTTHPYHSLEALAKPVHSKQQ